MTLLLEVFAVAAVLVLGAGVWMAVRQKPLPGPLGWGILPGDRAYVAGLPPARIRFQGIVLVVLGSVFLFDVAVRFRYPWILVGSLAQIATLLVALAAARRDPAAPNKRLRFVVASGLVGAVSVATIVALIPAMAQPTAGRADTAQDLRIDGAVKAVVRHSLSGPSCQTNPGGPTAITLYDQDTKWLIQLHVNRFSGPGNYVLGSPVGAEAPYAFVAFSRGGDPRLWLSLRGSLHVDHATPSSSSGTVDAYAEVPNPTDPTRPGLSPAHLAGSWSCPPAP